MKKPPLLSKEKLTKRWYDRIYAFCLRRLPDRENAEDAAQDVFLSFWEGPDFTDESTAAAWLYRSARNRIADYYRTEARHEKYEARIPPEELEDLAAPDRSDADDNGVFGEVLDELSSEEQRLFYAVWIDGIPYAELATEYGLSESGLRTRVSRLKKKIADIIRRLALPVLPAAAAISVFLRFFRVF